MNLHSNLNAFTGDTLCMQFVYALEVKHYYMVTGILFELLTVKTCVDSESDGIVESSTPVTICDATGLQQVSIYRS